MGIQRDTSALHVQFPVKLAQVDCERRAVQAGDMPGNGGARESSWFRFVIIAVVVIMKEEGHLTSYKLTFRITNEIVGEGGANVVTGGVGHALVRRKVLALRHTTEP